MSSKSFMERWTRLSRYSDIGVFRGDSFGLTQIERAAMNGQPLLERQPSEPIATSPFFGKASRVTRGRSQFRPKVTRARGNAKHEIGTGQNAAFGSSFERAKRRMANPRRRPRTGRRRHPSSASRTRLATEILHGRPNRSRLPEGYRNATGRVDQPW